MKLTFPASMAKLFRFAVPAIALALSTGPASAQQVEARRSWVNTVVATPQGGFLIGNNHAKTKLVEYVSYTCPHCAHFVNEASGPLKTQYISKGTTSVEIRSLVRDRFDLTAAMLARCGGPESFVEQHEALFANHEAWIEKASSYKPAVGANATHAQLMTDIAEKTGLIALMQKLGNSPAHSKACLADKGAMDRLMAMTKDAIDNQGVTGTPTFMVNGKLSNARDWASLRASLPAPAK